MNNTDMKMIQCVRCNGTKVDRRVIIKPRRRIIEIYCRTCGHKVGREVR